MLDPIPVDLVHLIPDAINPTVREKLDQFPCVVYLLDEEYRFRYVNLTAQRAWQRKRNALIGKTIWDALPRLKNTFIQLQHRLALQSKREMHFCTESPVLGQKIEMDIYPNVRGLSVHAHRILYGLS